MIYLNDLIADPFAAGIVAATDVLIVFAVLYALRGIIRGWL